MITAPFSLEYRKDIESGKYRVQTYEGVPARIVSWDVKGDRPIMALLSEPNGDGSERPQLYYGNGKLYGDGFKGTCRDLMVVIRENTYRDSVRQTLASIEDKAVEIFGLTEQDYSAIRAAHRMLGEDEDFMNQLSIIKNTEANNVNGQIVEKSDELIESNNEESLGARLRNLLTPYKVLLDLLENAKNEWHKGYDFDAYGEYYKFRQAIYTNIPHNNLKDLIDFSKTEEMENNKLAK